MASETLLICVLMLSSVRVIKSDEALFNVKCQPAVGVIGQITHISCSIESQTGNVIINTVSLTRFRENKSCFTFQPYENRVTGDSRFKVESLPSLQLHNTAISDEGGYKYYIRTNQGNDNVTFTINVTATYRSPIITSEAIEIESGGGVDLYCRSSGGYPAGTIHWFDQRNTNWTNNSTLQITQGHNGLFTLSSKLSFRSIDKKWRPFRCVVLNYRYEEEEEDWYGVRIYPCSSSSPAMLFYIIIAIVVSGSLMAVLVIVFSFFKQRVDQQLKKARSMDFPGLDFDRDPADIKEKEGLNECVYNTAADAEETSTV